MGDFLDFLLQATAEFGIVTALLLAMSVALGGYIFQTFMKKDKLMKNLIEKQQEQTSAANENTRSAINEIKEMSIITVTEVSRLSGELRGAIEIMKVLLGLQLKDGKNKEVD